ncbi:hypothetical protein C8Q80DRAFT_374440 [Daedaleopsis nitida]|nr:hypothetical protein C8Q80DRAFT_374440 [Daedaleopsis nitida]
MGRDDSLDVSADCAHTALISDCCSKSKSSLRHGLRQLFTVFGSGTTTPTTSSLTTVPIPLPLTLDELETLIRDAAHDFSLARNVSKQPGAGLLTLIDVLADQYLVSALSLPSSSQSEPNALVTFLTCVCDEGFSGELLAKHQDAYRTLLDLSLPDASGTYPRIHEDSDTFTREFCKILAPLWSAEKWIRSKTESSPMPWSARSLKEGIPPPPGSYDVQAPTPVVPSAEDRPVLSTILRDDLMYFPDMVWLGGRHDGYDRATSLSAYVWIRFSTVKSRREHLALWQSALSFGVLEVITGMRIPESLLLEAQPDGRNVLTSKKVSLLISIWLFGDSVPSLSGRSRIRTALEHGYDTVYWALSATNEAAYHFRRGWKGVFRDTTPPMTQHDVEDIICTLNSLSDSLWYTVLTTIRTAILKMEYRPLPTRYAPEALDIAWMAYQRKLVTEGWCPYTMTLLSYELQSLGYACSLPPFLRSSATDEHVNCTRAGCVANNLDTEEYRTQHAPSCSHPSCPFLSPSLAHVSVLLSAGHVPVIVYDGNTLTVRDSSSGPYIAISHVWADGLGSTTEDGLPTCQIARIAAYARELVPGGAFWVDSLCVPTKRELRKRAIRLMAQTYERAAKVVVFDAGVRTFCSSATPLRDVFLRLTTCSWMQRVWTLQEALLARELQFEFSDGLVPIATLHDAHSAAFAPAASFMGPFPSDFAVYRGVSNNVLVLLQNLAPSRPKWWFSIVDIISLLGNRTTSKPEDETLAIAGLFRIDAAKLLAETDADARMKVFLLALGVKLPATIIFNTVPKLRFPGLRWAPRALSSLGTVQQTEHEGMARCTPEGLATEEKFTLILLPQISIGDVDAPEVDNIYIVEPATGATYIHGPLKGRAGGAAVTVNGLVTSSKYLKDLKEGIRGSSTIPVVAVRIATSDGASYPEVSSWKPVMCEYVFSAHLSEGFSSMPEHKTAADLSKSDGPVVEGRFVSARIILG